VRSYARQPSDSASCGRRFDCEPAGRATERCELWLGYRSPHTLALERARPGACVLDLGCAGGALSEILQREKGCRVIAVDRVPPARRIEVEELVVHDLEEGPPDLDLDGYDQILMLDVLEHLSSPESFVEKLCNALRLAPQTELLVSTANIGFFINRLMLLVGQFNYGRRGVLDITHTRLFTFTSFLRLFEQAGFRVAEAVGVPGPFPLALGDNALARALVRCNQWLIRVSRGLFSYQVFLVVRPLPSLEYLLREAHSHSARRAEVNERRPR
jgi:2-polyprenyl-3-methyl-5-hydroxy-6-metoxy-1,4-benzoquinol methylase